MAGENETRIRDGEVTLEFDPADRADAEVSFIGTIRSPWTSRAECPRNISRARETGQGARIELDPAYRAALAGLSVGQPLVLIYWMNHARRDLVLQAPRHTDGPRGTFALRSPNRPNPVALSAVTITSIDAESGTIRIDAIDCLDRTPLVDMKPWLASIDMPAGKTLAETPE